MIITTVRANVPVLALPVEATFLVKFWHISKDFGRLGPLIAGGGVATVASIALRRSDMSRSS